jgi:hypothetical protein
MGAGAALAMETSDVTLLDSNLEKLEYCILMGKRVTRKIIENIIFSISVKFIVLGFTLAGKTHLWAAIASDVGAMILVTLNSMMLLPRSQKGPDVVALKGDVEEGEKSRSGLARRTSSSTIADLETTSPPISICEKAYCEKKKSHPTNHDYGQSSTQKSDCQKGCCSKNETSSCQMCCCSENETSSCQKGGCSEKEANSCKKGCCPKKECREKNAHKSNDNSHNQSSSGSSGCKKGCCAK